MKNFLLMICAIFITESAMAVSYIPSSGCFDLSEYVDLDEDAIDVSFDAENFSLQFSYGFIQGIGICSSTTDTLSHLGTPLSDNGENCWCQLTGINIAQSHDVFVAGSLENAVFKDTYRDFSECNVSCADFCVNGIKSNKSFRSLVYGHVEKNDFCPSCSTLSSIIPGYNCNATISGSSYERDGTWSVNQGSTVIYGASICSAYGPEFGVINDDGGNYCYCRITRYDYGSTAISATDSSWYYSGADDQCNSIADCADLCAGLGDTLLCPLAEYGSFCIDQSCVKMGDIFDFKDLIEASHSGSDFTLTYSNGEIYGTGVCSKTFASTTGDTSSSLSSDSGDNCWCNFTGYDPGSGTHSGTLDTWFYVGSAPTCSTNCGSMCASAFEGSDELDDMYKYDFCPETSSGPTTYNVTYACGTGSGNAPTDSNSPYTSGSTVTTLSNTCTPPSGQVFRTWSCGGTNVNAGSSFTISEDTTCTAQYGAPLTVTYSCGTGSGTPPTDSNSPYPSGSTVNTLANTCTKTNNRFTGWSCGGTNVSAGGSFTITANTTCTAQWSECAACAATNASCTLSVVNNTCRYTTSCNNGYGNIQNNGKYNASCSACTACAATHASCSLSTVNNVCTYATSCDNGYGNIVNNGAYNASCSALPTPVFTVTKGDTSSTQETSFKFSMTAVGTFVVDCGDHGILTSSVTPTDVSGNNTITRTNTNATVYTCTWTNTNEHTIGFSGTATDYTTNESAAAISFFAGQDNSWRMVNARKITSVSGNLSAMFPYKSGNSASGAQPRFYKTFNYASHLASIPSTLFANYTTASTGMFNSTFSNCVDLGGTDIPSNLFFPNATNGVSGAVDLFRETFAGCTGLTSLPSGLFSKITSGASNMFQYTFNGCTNLTSLPSDLFSNITSGASNMFYRTFQNCTNLGCETTGCSTGTGYIPSTMFAGITPRGSNATDTMSDTFYGTKLVEACPVNTQYYVTGWEGLTTWNNKVSCIQDVSHNITYVMDGGTNYNGAPSTYKEGTGATINGIPTKSGYTFAGWCTDSGLQSCAMSQTIGTDATTDQTFYAKWTQCSACAATNASCTFAGVVGNVCTYTTSCNTGYGNIQNNGKYNASCSANSYTISYENMTGATNYTNAPTSYTYGVGATINGIPTKSGYTFAGWCTDSGLATCSMSQTVATDTTGNKTFYAKWTQCSACAATNASCTFAGVVGNVCTYTTSCNTGYGNIQNNGAYNASCSANTITITWNGAVQSDIEANEAGTTTYGGDIRTPVRPDPAQIPVGQRFKGWRFRKPTQ